MAKKTLPPKPYPSYPLFAHRNGSWKKKMPVSLGSGVESFGPWRWPNQAEYEQSWRDALAEYNRRTEARAKGIELAAKPELVTITHLIDAYLSAQEDRVGKEIEPRTFAERRKILTRFRDTVGDQHTVGWLEDRPEIIVAYLSDLEDDYGFHRFNAHVKEIAGAFIAAEHPLTGVLKRPFRLRPLLKRKREIHRRREKRQKIELHGKQRFTPDELRAFFDHAEQPFKAMLWLAYFAGFGNSDCADAPQTVFNDKPAKGLGVPDGWVILDWRRPKTEIDRAAVLPDFVWKDLQQAMAARPEPRDRKRHGNLVFLTAPHAFIRSARGGLPFVRDIVHTDEQGSILKTVRSDSVQKAFDQLRGRLSHCPEHGWLCKPMTAWGRGFRSDLKKLKRRKHKVEAFATCPRCGKACKPMRKLGFYVFRHTATTYAIPAASLEARVLFEGHGIEGVRAHYVEELDTAELVKIAERLILKMNEGKAHSEPTVTHSAESSSAVSAA